MCNLFNRFSKFLLLANTFIVVGTLPKICWAEGVAAAGVGEEGVNRRVITPSTGYSKVEGTFSEPDFYVPNPNTAIDKPSFYMGGNSNQVETDAGFQWDTTITRYNFPASWTVFVRAGNVWTNYSKDMKNPWLANQGGLGSSIGMSYQVNSDGTIVLTVSGLSSASPSGFNCGLGKSPTTERNKKYNVFENGSHHFPAYSPANISSYLSNMAVKRVVAMTQDKGRTIDGSYMRNLGFENGQVYKSQRNADGTYSLVPVQGGWPLSAVGGNTGYDTGDWAYDKSLTTSDKRRWIVDFDFAGMATPTLRGPGDTKDPQGTYRNAKVVARYADAETVHISLENGPARAKGKKLR